MTTATALNVGDIIKFQVEYDDFEIVPGEDSKPSMKKLDKKFQIVYIAMVKEVKSSGSAIEYDSYTLRILISICSKKDYNPSPGTEMEYQLTEQNGVVVLMKEGEILNIVKAFTGWVKELEDEHKIIPNCS